MTVVVAAVATVVTGAVVVASTEIGLVVVDVGKLVTALTTPDVVEATVVTALEVVPVTTPETVAAVVLIVAGTTETVPVTVGTAAFNNNVS